MTTTPTTPTAVSAAPDSAPPADAQALATVWGAVNAMVVSRAVHLAARDGIADRIDEQGVETAELASACGYDPEALDRVLRLLAAHGIFAREGTSYRHTAASRLLRSDHPLSMRAFGQMMGQPVFWSSFGALDHSLRTGRPALETIEPQGLWSYLASHPDEARVFEQAMTAKSRADVAAVLATYDFSPFRVIADIGGGRGHLLRAVLESSPGSRGVLFELPAVVEALEPPPARAAYHPGDFFVDPLPRADAYVLMEVIHDWADAEATQILRAIRSAAAPGATVLIIEGVVPEAHDDPRVHTLDVIMLAVTGGRERTPRELGGLLESAGFRLSSVIPTQGPMSLVEAVAV